MGKSRSSSRPSHQGQPGGTKSRWQDSYQDRRRPDDRDVTGIGNIDGIIHAHSLIGVHTEVTKMKYKEIKSVSFNCLGFKSSSAFIDNLCIEYDICFLCEHWLKPCELPFAKSLYKDKNIWSLLTSSVDPESVSSGRPHGGVGFLCKESGNVTYRVLEVSSDRL